MAIRHSLLEALRRAPRFLGREAAASAGRFIESSRGPDGGFRGRGASSDLYYTGFALGCLAALGESISAEPILSYLRSFGDGEGLDLIHLSSLARSWALLDDLGVPSRNPGTESIRSSLLERVAAHRSGDGGFNRDPAAAAGSAYGCFLGLGAYGDLGALLPRREGLEACLSSLFLGGGYANEAGIPVPTAPATAAALVVLREIGIVAPQASVDWLIEQTRARGGFAAMPGVPEADLLSTATTLHALALAGTDLSPLRPSCLEFVRAHLAEGGGFRDRPGGGEPDCEYTFYGLLALGHLEH